MMQPRKVFGIGFNKTGTSTLSKCFELLGLVPVASPQALHDSFMADSFRSYFPGGTCLPLAGKYSRGPASADPFGPFPFRAIFNEVSRHKNYELAIHIAKSFQAFEDRPWNVGNLYQHLDIAFPGSLFILTWREPESCWRSTENWLNVTHQRDPIRLEWWRQHLGADRFDKDTFIAGYRAHNDSIRAYFSDRTDFLDVNFEQGDSWQHLCSFLGVPIPDHPFPQENRQRYAPVRCHE